MKMHLDQSPPLVKPDPDYCAHCGYKVEHRAYLKNRRYYHAHCYAVVQQDDLRTAFITRGTWNGA